MPTQPVRPPGDEDPVFVISVAAELAGMHAQTLRQYDRLGLVIPSRTRGGGRRYSARNVTQLREIQRLSQEEGVSLAGIARILELENRVQALHQRIGDLQVELDRSRSATEVSTRIFSVTSAGDVSTRRLGERPAAPRGRSLILWRPSV